MEKGYVLITGADSGIGREFAKLFSAEGYRIILTARNREKLEKVSSALSTENRIIALDLSDATNCYRLLEETADLPIDIFVNNAGFGDFGLIDETDTAKALTMIDVNCKATLILVKEFIKRFKRTDRGQILTVASSAAFAPAPYMAEYYATKAFVLRLMLGYRQELLDEKSHVRISVLCPGPVKTNFENVANVKFTIKSLSAETVAAYAIKKMKHGKTVIVPGTMMKIAHVFSKVSNEKIAAKVLDKVAKNPDHVKK